MDGTSEDVVADYRTIITELEMYGEGLVDKPRLTVLNKIDALAPDDVETRRRALAKAAGAEVMTMSGVAGIGTVEVLRALRRMIGLKPHDAPVEPEDGDAPWSPV